MQEEHDIGFMQMALDMAARGSGTTSPNPLVGAVVVRDGEVVGRGFHEAAGKAHAEVNAIEDAGAAAEGATLYVTLEPCNHIGRTPPCTRKILTAGIRRVVFAMADPNPHVAGGGADYLSEQGLEVTAGVLAGEALRQNDWFVKYIRSGLPFVTAKCAATLDGRIAASTGDARWVTGEASRTFVHRQRHAVDAIMVGRRTVEMDDPSLTTRLGQEVGIDPIRIILDTGLSTPIEAKVVRQSSPARTWIVCGPAVSAQRLRRFEAAGVRVLTSAVRDGRIDLNQLMERLGSEGVTSVLLEGGSTLMGAAIRSGIVDKVLFFYAPKITGGDDGFPICAGPGVVRMKDCFEVTDIRVHRFGSDVLIEGYIRMPAAAPQVDFS